MSEKIVDILAKYKGRWVEHYRKGYEESPTSLITTYDMSDLNSPNFDFRNAKMKKAAQKVTQFSDVKKIAWYEDNIKEQWFTASETAAAWTLKFDVDSDRLQPNDTLRNVATGERMLVTDVDGNEITVDANTKWVTSWDEFVRYGFAKTYGEYSARKIDFNEAEQFENYFQFTAEEIPETKTDILTNNLSRLFYDKTDDYIKELFAEASRGIVRTRMYSFYAGRPKETNKGGIKKIYETWGLDFFIPDSAYEVNIQGADSAGTMKKFRDELSKIYKSWVSWLRKTNRVMMMATADFCHALDDLFIDYVIKNNAENPLTKFGINVREYNISGYPIMVVNDPILDDLYPGEKVGFTIDTDGVVSYDLMHGVIGKDGKRTDAPRVSQLFIPEQTTPELRTVSLHSHFSYAFGNIGSGVYRKLVMTNGAS